MKWRKRLEVSLKNCQFDNTEDGSFLWNISTAHYSVSLKLDNVINPCMPLWRSTKKAFQKVNITWNTYILFIEKHTLTFILHWHLNTNEFLKLFLGWLIFLLVYLYFFYESIYSLSTSNTLLEIISDVNYF